MIVDVPLGLPTAPTTRFRAAIGAGVTVHLVAAGLACCAVEFVAAVSRHPDLLQVDDAADQSGTHVLVVSGTVTDKIAPAVLAAYAAMPEPRRVLSFGSCANSGGPYWDSYCVVKGIDQLIPVDAYVPGCPPRPEALFDGLRQLEARR